MKYLLIQRITTIFFLIGELPVRIPLNQRMQDAYMLTVAHRTIDGYFGIGDCKKYDQRKRSSKQHTSSLI